MLTLLLHLAMMDFTWGVKVNDGSKVTGKRERLVADEDLGVRVELFVPWGEKGDC